MRKPKRREYLSSELVQKFVQAYGLQEKMETIHIREFLESYLDEELMDEITSISLKDKILEIHIQSPLLKNDFKMRRSFFLKKFRTVIGREKIDRLKIL